MVKDSRVGAPKQRKSLTFSLFSSLNVFEDQLLHFLIFGIPDVARSQYPLSPEPRMGNVNCGIFTQYFGTPHYII